MARIDVGISIAVHSINPNKSTRHHRKPKSLLDLYTGRKKPNVIKVPRSKHEAWHTLFNNAPAEKVLKLFRGYSDIFDVTSRKTSLQRQMYEGWIESNVKNIKKQQAWDHLFGGKSLDEIVLEINTHWIDPEYEITVREKRIKTVNLTLKKVISP